VAAQLDHEPDAVLALGRERDGTGPVEARAVGGRGVRRGALSLRVRDWELLRDRRGQLTVLNPKRFDRD
jgi:hypothetical protein